MRYQSASDLRADLRRLKHDLDAGQPATVAAVSESQGQPVWKMLLQRRGILTPDTAIVPAVVQIENRSQDSSIEWLCAIVPSTEFICRIFW